jgi:HEAT repeat protein
VKVKQIIELLASTDEKQVKKALNGLKADGDSTVIEPLVQLLQKDVEVKTFQKEILEILSSLKDTSSVDAMVTVLRNDDYLQVRQLLLSTIWNSPLDYSNYLPDFVLIACEGDFLEALDCLTILENMPSEIEERHILEAQWHLKEYLENPEPKEERKAQIISEIALFIKDLDRNIEG